MCMTNKMTYRQSACEDWYNTIRKRRSHFNADEKLETGGLRTSLLENNKVIRKAKKNFWERLSGDRIEVLLQTRFPESQTLTVKENETNLVMNQGKLANHLKDSKWSRYWMDSEYILPIQISKKNNIYSALLQHGVDLLSFRLCNLLRTNLALASVCIQAWREIKVVFIPLPGPISLISFLPKVFDGFIGKYTYKEGDTE